MSDAERIEIMKKALAILELVVDDGDYLNYSGTVSITHRYIADLAMSEGDYEPVSYTHLAEKDRDGEIGQANAQRDQRIQVAAANALAIKGENESKIEMCIRDSFCVLATML